jgi:hypothetical protein
MQSSTRNESQAAPKLRSQFVTALAWFSIVVAALMTVSSVLQNVMVNFVLPSNLFDPLTSGDAPLPGFAVFVLKHFKLFVFAYFLLSVALLGVSIGLLQRKNWARIAFIALLALGIATSVLPLLMSPSTFSAMPNIDGMDAELVSEIATTVKGVVLALTILFAAIHGWLIYKLCTPQIRAEFA